MGYYLTSVFAVSSRDKHSYFFYYVSGVGREATLDYADREYPHKWIDNWFYDSFSRIASRVGPKGVIIAPSRRHDGQFLKEMLGVEDVFWGVHENLGGQFLSDDMPELDLLHDQSSYIVVSRTPFMKRASHSTRALIVDLTSCREESDLERILAAMESAVLADDLSILENLSLPEAQPAKRRDELEYSEALRYLELKPNLFGIGVNLNRVLERIAEVVTEWWRRKRPEP